MKKIFRTEAEWLSIISTCRSSGLSDHEWCLNNDIAPSSFYHAIERARSKMLPVAAHTSSVFPVRQEAVEIDLSPLEEVPKKPICDSDAVAIKASVRGFTNACPQMRERKNALKQKLPSGMLSGNGSMRWSPRPAANSTQR